MRGREERGQKNKRRKEGAKTNCNFRLLDRALMHVDAPAFWALNNWLDHVEKTLNPYKKYSIILYIYFPC
jgi:hypothetical protein